jgi:hypothetical protein
VTQSAGGVSSAGAWVEEDPLHFRLCGQGPVRQRPQPVGRGLPNIDRLNEMTYAMPGLGVPAATGTPAAPAATGTPAAPAATGTAAIERNSPAAEFTHALSFRRLSASSQDEVMSGWR